MDTLISHSPVAMGPGEQHAVHPFFRQGMNLTVCLDTFSGSHWISDFAASGKANHSLPNGNSTPTPTDAFAHPNQEQSFQLQAPCAPEILKPTVSTPVSQDEDANANRRKRRKTEKTKTDQEPIIQAGLSGWLGVEAPEPPAPAPILDTQNAPPTANRQSLQSPINPSGPVQDLSSKEQNEQNASDGSKRKVLKLNTNGRLLSSPPASSTGMADTKQVGGKRRRGGKVRSKTVILKYSIEGDKKTGILINEILSGQRAHKPTPPQPIAPPKQVFKGPPKPTHPFFVRKAAQKPQDDNTSGAGSGSEAHGAVKTTVSATPEIKRESRSFPTFPSTFSRNKSKFPELIEPLWPPKDLVHVRSDDSGQVVRPTNPDLITNDRKKAKSPAIVIGDGENALLTSTSFARESAKASMGGHDTSNLRLPVRYIASGRVLQTAIDNQMSWSIPNSRYTAQFIAPVISTLRSALLSSFSAFDRGKYESQLWAHKYAPKKAEDVLQVGREAQVLRDWLRHLKITAVDTGKPSKDNSRVSLNRDQKKKKRRKKNDKLDGFIVSSEEEASEMDNISGSDDELAGDVTVSAQRTVVRSGDLAFLSSHGEKSRVTNAILLSGPSGSGKTASVYAAAKELDFEVFEINAGSRRSARDMLERVGDMTQNHLVHLLNDTDDSSAKPRAPATEDDGKQNKLMGFFKGQAPKGTKSDKKSAQKSPTPDSIPKRNREQKQSLILLEEVDLLFDEDKQFWTGVLTLISQSKRPIVITCNNESLVPTQDMSLHAILRFQRPQRDLAIDYLLLVAANEGHVLKREAVSKLYDASGMDIRRSLMDLNFWCQIGVGSEKAGLDWILSLWPPEANLDQSGDRVRVLSLNTYEPYMGWFNRDLLLTQDPLENETETLRNTLHWWRLGIQDSEDAARGSDTQTIARDLYQSRSKMEQLDLLSCEADYLEMRSSLDLLCSECSLNMLEASNILPIKWISTLTRLQDVVDTSAPPPPEGYRSNYLESYPLLQADLRPEHSSLSEKIGLTFNALISRSFRPRKEDHESYSVARIFKGWTKDGARRLHFPNTLPTFQKVFEPIRRANYSLPIPNGRLAPSFENSLAPITEDIAPYIRAIMVFDGRLKEYRDNLCAVLTREHSSGEKRGRTTRASRAALEGGDKASTRKERWFPEDTNYFWVLGTGNYEWQKILYQMGHFHIQPSLEPTEETLSHDSNEQ
jgi:DNA polymerase III delta prime subunit